MFNLIMVFVMSDANERSVKHRKANRAARLAAVQALYQMELADRGAEAVIKEFMDHRFSVKTMDGEAFDVNKKLFAEIVRTTYEKHIQIDDMIIESLPSSWTIERLDTVLRAILRAACGEFLMDKNLAAAIIIDEYINVTRDFFVAKEPGLVNGILNHVAVTLGLKMRDDPKIDVKELIKDENISGTSNWESEGGSDE